MYCVVGFRSLAPVHRGWTANAQFNRCSYTISINGIQLVRHGIYEPSAIHCPTDLTNFETCIAPTAHIRENHPLFIVAAAGDLVSTAEKLSSDGKKNPNALSWKCSHFLLLSFFISFVSVRTRTYWHGRPFSTSFLVSAYSLCVSPYRMSSDFVIRNSIHQACQPSSQL